MVEIRVTKEEQHLLDELLGSEIEAHNRVLSQYDGDSDLQVAGRARLRERIYRLDALRGAVQTA